MSVEGLFLAEAVLAGLTAEVCVRLATPPIVADPVLRFSEKNLSGAGTHIQSLLRKSLGTDRHPVYCSRIYCMYLKPLGTL